MRYTDLKYYGLDRAKHVTLYTEHKRLLRTSYFKIPAQIPPLSYSEVKQCLVDFLKRTAIVLQDLHSHGFAHFDVRVPNVCFSKEDESDKYFVKLIDLDRCVSTEDEPPDTSTYGGAEMNRYPDVLLIGAANVRLETAWLTCSQNYPCQSP